MSKTLKHLTTFGLTLMIIAFVASLRGLPMMSEYGLSIVFYLLVAIIVFLVPVSLVAAELATGWPQKGGVFIWVKKGLGPRWGFMAIWLQWIQNITFYPTALAATAAVLAYIINPELASNKIFTLTLVLVVYWGGTFINFRGTKLASRLVSLGVIMGMIVPGIILIASGIIWVMTGHQSNISFDWQSFIPNLGDINHIVFLSGVFLFFAGMEVATVHAHEVKNPQKTFPKAILLASVIIALIFIFGAVSIAIIIPKSDISLTAGIMQTFEKIFDTFNVSWLVPIIAILVAPGMIAQILSWIGGPSKGLLVTAEHGMLPPFFQKVNKHDIPTNILWIQGSIVTILSLVFLIMPSVSSSFWILSALTVQVYLVMYILMFISAIRLKYSEPNVKRAFCVPGGNAGMWFFACLGIIAALFAMFLGYFPPSQLKTGNILFFEGFLIIGMIIMAGAPHVIYAFKKPSWAQNNINKNNSKEKKENAAQKKES